ncbi:Multi antimicrobial extrusion protein (Na(+)/drug antiporter), MATE family of MDR efflux pumps [Methanosarcina siciliae C2J]|uniref:Multidrug export protein MepA n=1 Tax=Methanosarcina siciliae C2J TaxID=1434118 RepID=A0A0E3LD86_9EURY|nr:MATE family efflux transporter [Methanosarcina siciliae]AKB36836.1 Multi antimicrobial extrusion protein (Na(+)/drug antiporter), MATE family of MDR efflux pumps [Methanosarcina siciliae C2J]
MGKLLFKLSAPSIIGMLVYAFYNIVDTIFVGRALGEESVSGIGGLVIAFPIHMLAMGVAIGLGVGGSSIVSRALGSKELHRAEKALGTVFFLGVFLGLAYSLIGLSFIEPLLKLFGATPGIMPYARSYLEIIMAGSVVFTLGIAAEDLVRAEGNARYAMFGMLLGAGLNIVLDPVFILGLDMGVRGAAVATVLAQLVSTAFLLRYFLAGKGSVAFKPGFSVPDSAISKEVVAIGIGPFIVEASNSVMMIFVNNALATYGGDVSIAAFGIIHRLLLLIFLPMLGISFGLQPIVGYNYGAKQFSRVIESVKVALKVSTLFSLPGFLVMFLFPAPIIHIFSPDPELTAAGARAMRIVVLILPFIGFQLVGTTVFQALGKPKPAFFLSLARQLLFLLPLVLVLPRFYGLDGVWAAFPISDFLACVLAAGLLEREYQKFKTKEKKEKSFQLSLEIEA